MDGIEKLYYILCGMIELGTFHNVFEDLIREDPDIKTIDVLNKTLLGEREDCYE
jgi:hypothetical protein